MEMPSDMEGSGLLAKTQISWLPMARVGGGVAGARLRELQLVKSFCAAPAASPTKAAVGPHLADRCGFGAGAPELRAAEKTRPGCDGVAHSIAIARPRAAPPELRVLLCAPACGTFMTSGRTAVLLHGTVLDATAVLISLATGG
jgi:hypothetical protein